MWTSARPHSTAGDLLRLIAVWLAAILIVQGVAASQALGQGPLHRHADRGALGGSADAHHHDGGERHVHPVTDSSVVPADQLAIDDAAFAITAALALMLAGCVARSLLDTRRHVWRSATVRTWRDVVADGLLRPPRAG